VNVAVPRETVSEVETVSDPLVVFVRSDVGLLDLLKVRCTVGELVKDTVPVDDAVAVGKMVLVSLALPLLVTDKSLVSDSLRDWVGTTVELAVSLGENDDDDELVCDHVPVGRIENDNVRVTVKLLVCVSEMTFVRDSERL
jgi:hypothetical protein